MRSRKEQDRQKRKNRVRARVRGTAARPRLTVSRSLSQLTVQIIDDETGKTLVAATTNEANAKPNTEGAKKLGELIAKKAQNVNVTTVVFDRNGYKYHGRLQAVADAAREGGLTF